MNVYGDTTLTMNSQPTIKQAKETVVFMRWSGQRDKNRKEMYEGDIIKQTYGTKTFIGVMRFRNDLGRFGVEIEDQDEGEIESENGIVEVHASQVKPEIIGNIYENPELIGVKK
jgi:uncharacterized phage protein (TIGR01671 family)